MRPIMYVINTKSITAERFGLTLFQTGCIPFLHFFFFLILCVVTPDSRSILTESFVIEVCNVFLAKLLVSRQYIRRLNQYSKRVVYIVNTLQINDNFFKICMRLSFSFSILENHKGQSV